MLVVISTVGGLGIMLWLGMEDSDLLPAICLAAGSTALISLHILVRLWGGRQLVSRLALAGLGLALGAGWGAGTSLTTAALMLLKTALHSHIQPDFPWPLFPAILARAPAWGVAGALIGLGMALLRIAATFPSPRR